MKIDHIAIAVFNLDEGSKRMENILGSKAIVREKVESEGIEAVIFKVGTTKIELVCPLSEDSVVAKFLRKRGEGLHHIALAVDDMDEEVERLRSKQVTLVGEAPRVGAMGRKVMFVHPKSTPGVLLELVETPKGE
ncbi:MAG: methylmalonyl-CoA epimerase [Candidatus Thermoplasmatota archaeon]|nr:methylmalonyl-CoA epimerase [Candidatus Thermoplasmatota archaeon]